MLKYVALMTVDQPEHWHQWHSGPTARNCKSPIDTDKAVVEAWLAAQLEKFPDARVNEKIADRKYFIQTAIIAFDDTESANLGDYLNRLIPLNSLQPYSYIQN